MNRLETLGWCDFFAQQPRLHALALMDDTIIARVSREDRERYELVTEAGRCTARLGGGMRYRASSREELPAVGDWVVARLGGDDAMIIGLYERRTMLARQAAGERTGVQIIAANVDTIFIVTSMNQEFVPRRLERYLLAARDSGAEPVFVLNKRDLASDPERFVERARAVSAGAPVVAISALEGAEPLEPWITDGRTVALVGSSGVGKSTLINALAGAEIMATGAIRGDDDEGRHTTTARHLHPLPSGGILIDTPGMRELQLWASDSDVDDLFADIAELALECRFRDCRHVDEPGCAVLAAIDDGSLHPGRLASYQKLGRELEWHRRRQDVAAARAEYRRLGKMYRAVAKAKPNKN